MQTPEEQLAVGLAQIQATSAGFDAGLREFERRIDDLPHVPNVEWTVEVRGEPVILAVRRSGGTYRIVCRKDKSEWKNLAESSLDIKIAAVESFPGLLDRMVEEQKSLVARMEAATLILNRMLGKEG